MCTILCRIFGQSFIIALCFSLVDKVDAAQEILDTIHQDIQALKKKQKTCPQFLHQLQKNLADLKRALPRKHDTDSLPKKQKEIQTVSQKPSKKKRRAKANSQSQMTPQSQVAHSSLKKGNQEKRISEKAAQSTQQDVRADQAAETPPMSDVWSTIKADPDYFGQIATLEESWLEKLTKLQDESGRITANTTDGWPTEAQIKGTQSTGMLFNFSMSNGPIRHNDKTTNVSLIFSKDEWGDDLPKEESDMTEFLVLWVQDESIVDVENPVFTDNMSAPAAFIVHKKG